MTLPKHSRAAVSLTAALLVTFATRVPAWFAPRHLTFDDGTFAQSVLLMREGKAPFEEIFSSQAPLFLPLLWLGDLAGGRTLNSPRTTGVVSALVLVAATWSAARAISGRLEASCAALLVGLAGSVLRVTGPVAADGPALALGMIGISIALKVRATTDRRVRSRAAWLAGAAVGASLATKSIELPMLVPILLVFGYPAYRYLRKSSISRQEAVGSLVHCGTVVGMCAVVYFVAAMPWGLSNVWDQAVRYRSQAAVDRDPAANFSKLISTTLTRDTSVWVFAAVLGVHLWGKRLVRIRKPLPSEVNRAETASALLSPGVAPAPSIIVGYWAAACLAWLTFAVDPLFRPHVSAVVPPVALAAALAVRNRRAAAVAALAALPFLWLQNREFLIPKGYSGTEAQLVDQLRRLPKGARGLADEPGFLWRAGIRTTGDLVDPSVLRIRQGRITVESLVTQASLPDVCAVVVWSKDRFGSFENLPDRLYGSGYRAVATWGRYRVLYLKSNCEPSGTIK